MRPRSLMRVRPCEKWWEPKFGKVAFFFRAKAGVTKRLYCTVCFSKEARKSVWDRNICGKDSARCVAILFVWCATIVMAPWTTCPICFVWTNRNLHTAFCVGCFTFTTLRKQRSEQEDMSTPNITLKCLLNCSRKRTRILQHKNPNGINSKSHVFLSISHHLTLVILVFADVIVAAKSVPIHVWTARTWSGALSIAAPELRHDQEIRFSKTSSHTQAMNFFLNQPSPKIHRPAIPCVSPRILFATPCRLTFQRLQM